MSTILKYAQYLSEQEKRNVFNSDKLLLERRVEGRGGNTAGGSGKDAHYAGDYDTMKGMAHVDRAVEHAAKMGYKVNHRDGQGNHSSTNIFDDEKHKAPHKKPDVTLHYAYGDDAPHAYTVHHDGAAAHDKRMHKQAIHTHNENEKFD